MRGAACRDKKNTGVKNPWKELPGERKGGRNLLCCHDAFVRYPKARIQRGYGSPDPRLDTVCPCLDQIKRVVFFVHPGFRSVLLGYEGNGSLKAASSNQQIALSSPRSRGGAGSRDDFIRPSRFQSPFETSERPILIRTLESKIRGIFPHARTIPIRINGRNVDPRRYSQSWTIEKFR